MEIIHRSRKLNTDEYVEGSLYINDDDRHFILPKATLWRTESEGDDMRSVYVAHEVYKGYLSMWTGKEDKYGTKIFMACHGLGDEYNGADMLVRGHYSGEQNDSQDRQEALQYPTSLAFTGVGVKYRGHWTPEDWDKSVCYWGAIEVVGIHP